MLGIIGWAILDFRFWILDFGLKVISLKRCVTLLTHPTKLFLEKSNTSN